MYLISWFCSFFESTIVTFLFSESQLKYFKTYKGSRNLKRKGFSLKREKRKDFEKYMAGFAFY